MRVGRRRPECGATCQTSTIGHNSSHRRRRGCSPSLTDWRRKRPESPAILRSGPAGHLRGPPVTDQAATVSGPLQTGPTAGAGAPPQAPIGGLRETDRPNLPILTVAGPARHQERPPERGRATRRAVRNPPRRTILPAGEELAAPRPLRPPLAISLFSSLQLPPTPAYNSAQQPRLHLAE